MEKIGDTNIFYDIAASRVAPSQVVEDGDVLLISPMSVLEIVSKITENNFIQRKHTAQAALEHAKLLDDPERVLEQIWKVPVSDDGAGNPWLEGLTAVAQAANLTELTTGVKDWQRRVIRTVNVGHAANWRTMHYEDFAVQMEHAADELVPGYKKRRDEGKMKQANEETRMRVSMTLAPP